MASINDIYNQIVQTNNNLQQIDADVVSGTAATNTVKTSVDAVTAAVDALASEQSASNLILRHMSEQMDTMICILEHISKNTCELLNEADAQRRLQEHIERDGARLLEEFAFANPAAAVESERIQKLQEELRKCCPPAKPPQPCNYQPCPAPEPIEEAPAGGK